MLMETKVLSLSLVVLDLLFHCHSPDWSSRTAQPGFLLFASHCAEGAAPEG